MIEKAKALKLSGAKRSDYGGVGKYINFTDKDGKKALVSLSQKAIDKDL
jgi:hypothetical protein